MKISFSKVNSLAWKIKKTGKSWSDSMKAAYAGLRAKAQLQSEICRITFEKANGEITSRVGTLLSEFLPASTGQTKRANNSPKITFFSLSDGGFRSFLPQNLLRIEVESTALAIAA